jgi:hypothetical protein
MLQQPSGKISTNSHAPELALNCSFLCLRSSMLTP